VFAANRTGPVNVLINDGSGTLTPSSATALGILTGDQANDGITTGDVDGDGDLDLLLAGQGYGHLYLNDGDGTFTYRRTFSGPWGYMGGFADIDNDTDLDLVFAGADHVYLNDGTATFTSVSFSPGAIGNPRSVAFADIDHDGDLDFFYAQKDTFNRMIRNDYSGSNNWLKIRLVTSQGQLGAFGAKTRVYPAGTTDLLGLRESRSVNGYLAQDDPELHFGLGHVETVDVVVTFLNGPPVVLTDVAANQVITVTQ
jgi:hypothetical protein